MLKIHIMDCDAIYGLVDYGYLDSETNGGYAAKMRCRKCGAAWLDINYVDGHDLPGVWIIWAQICGGYRLVVLII